ncbi:tetratricopeptide repeat protein [Rhizohabitans arisaemae]|uniref:tetratricopeptide repeat protein n=1 Tax=Rhizohabitans arisaemae TaxID=2720610 RepID=UPI0024B0466C|nr:hypothetical protein [Rhizohabitans arisaemae]
MTVTPGRVDTGDGDTGEARCDRARTLAERGDLAAAAEIFAELAADPGSPWRAQAAVGLAVVREAGGDVEGARAAARIAVASGHPEYAAQGAYHLARGFEGEGLVDQARAAWQAVVGTGNPGYLPAAHLALARLAQDPEEAERALRAAVGTGHPTVVTRAAADLAERLLARDEAEEAARVLHAAIAVATERDTARLHTLLGIAHLELACGALITAVRAETDDRASAALAVELLARTLPLRGREEDAEKVWRHGLEHPDPAVADDVYGRLRRGFAVEEQPSEADGPAPWWDPFVEQAVSSGTLPVLTAEAFAALDGLYVTGEPLDPEAYAWGSALERSFLDRLGATPD